MMRSCQQKSNGKWTVANTRRFPALWRVEPWVAPRRAPQVVLCTFRSAKRLLGQSFGAKIIDEAHHLARKTRTKALAVGWGGGACWLRESSGGWWLVRRQQAKSTIRYEKT